jgi:hypothetical protein
MSSTAKHTSELGCSEPNKLGRRHLEPTWSAPNNRRHPQTPQTPQHTYCTSPAACHTQRDRVAEAAALNLLPRLLIHSTHHVCMANWRVHWRAAGQAHHRNRTTQRQRVSSVCVQAEHTGGQHEGCWLCCTETELLAQTCVDESVSLPLDPSQTWPQPASVPKHP